LGLGGEIFPSDGVAPQLAADRAFVAGERRGDFFLARPALAQLRYAVSVCQSYYLRKSRVMAFSANASIRLSYEQLLFGFGVIRRAG